MTDWCTWGFSFVFYESAFSGGLQAPVRCVTLGLTHPSRGYGKFGRWCCATTPWVHPRKLDQQGKRKEKKRSKFTERNQCIGYFIALQAECIVCNDFAVRCWYVVAAIQTKASNSGRGVSLPRRVFRPPANASGWACLGSTHSLQCTLTPRFHHLTSDTSSGICPMLF